MKRINCSRCKSSKEVPDDWNYKLCPECRDYMKKWIINYRKTHPKYVKINNTQGIKRNYDIKLEVFIHYGGNPPKCACCGETIIEFLTIDHINGKGNKHRKQVGAGTKFYRWLIKNNFPEGFQVLCMNCNWGKRVNNGICPHNRGV